MCWRQRDEVVDTLSVWKEKKDWERIDAFLFEADVRLLPLSLSHMVSMTFKDEEELKQFEYFIEKMQDHYNSSAKHIHYLVRNTDADRPANN